MPSLVVHPLATDWRAAYATRIRGHPQHVAGSAYQARDRAPSATRYDRRQADWKTDLVEVIHTDSMTEHHTAAGTAGAHADSAGRSRLSYDPLQRPAQGWPKRNIGGVSWDPDWLDVARCRKQEANARLGTALVTAIQTTDRAPKTGLSAGSFARNQVELATGDGAKTPQRQHTGDAFSASPA